MIPGFHPLKSSKIIQVSGTAPSYTVPAGSVFYVHSVDAANAAIDGISCYSTGVTSNGHMVDRNRLLFQGVLYPVRDALLGGTAAQSGHAVATGSDVVVSPAEYLYAVAPGSTFSAGSYFGQWCYFWGELGSDAASSPVSVSVTVNSSDSGSSSSSGSSSDSSASSSDAGGGAYVTVNPVAWSGLTPDDANDMLLAFDAAIGLYATVVGVAAASVIWKRLMGGR